MCGRFVSPDERSIEAYWQVAWSIIPPLFESRSARYNVAPQRGNEKNCIPVLRQKEDGELEVTRMQ